MDGIMIDHGETWKGKFVEMLEGKNMEELTRRTRSKQRWRWISRRRSVGNARKIDSSSTPRVASHLY